MELSNAITTAALITAFNCYIIRWAWEYGMKMSENLWRRNKEESLFRTIALYLAAITGEFILVVSACILS